MFERFNRARNYILFQQYIKGENLLIQKILENGGQGTPSALGSELGFSSPRVAAMLGSLETKKLIKRSSYPSDKRKTVVELTSIGREWAEYANFQVYGLAGNIIHMLGEEDAKEFVRICKKLLGEDSENLSAESDNTDINEKPIKET